MADYTVSLPDFADFTVSLCPSSSIEASNKSTSNNQVENIPPLTAPTHTGGSEPSVGSENTKICNRPSGSASCSTNTNDNSVPVVNGKHPRDYLEFGSVPSAHSQTEIMSEDNGQYRLDTQHELMPTAQADPRPLPVQPENQQLPKYHHLPGNVSKHRIVQTISANVPILQIPRTRRASRTISSIPVLRTEGVEANVASSENVLYESPSDRQRALNINCVPKSLEEQIPKFVVSSDASPCQESPQSSTDLNIRDSARIYGRSHTSLGQKCESCSRLDVETSYCNMCDMTFCHMCWNNLPPHRLTRRAPGVVPHERTNQVTAKKIQNILTPDVSDEQRVKLHTTDDETTWFGVAREGGEQPLLRDYGRYANLMTETKTRALAVTPISPILSHQSDRSDVLYPSLVSFVGQTGAGKSTLIKLLIDLNAEEGERFPTPVTGAAGRGLSTSEDVHLYLDPSSSDPRYSQTPLLYADCEGLEGGEREPVGARIKRSLEKRATETNEPSQRPKHNSERELLWATSARTKSREYAVAHLYPRLLYTFSDVIVFVLNNERVIESVLQRLIDWAQSALEKSSNQPILPHAIIVLNASGNDTPEEQWDVEGATSLLDEHLRRRVVHSDVFRAHAKFWEERERRIETVEELVLSYYSGLRVVRIPTTGRPNLICNQIEKLSKMIHTTSRTARTQKANLRMLLDADEFQVHLQIAFDHFAKTLDTPFDFVKASFTNSPIPNDFGGNILKVALRMVECWANISASAVFEKLSLLVASCIMLDATRNKIRGSPDILFPQYLTHIDSALENFCDRHWPCEYKSSKGRCVNVRSGHGAKGHQMQAGKLLADGEYFSTFTFDGYRREFRDLIYYDLLDLNRLVRKRAERSIPEELAAAEVHKESVLPLLFQHAFLSDPQAFVSHTMCFCCLLEPPEHSLPCGHVICTPCLKLYGKIGYLNRIVEIAECPLEQADGRFSTPWKIHLKPANCGIRVLTLDGGGVRGVVEIEILRQLEEELGGHISVQKFFDLIVGTSTGGIVALGLTARNWTLDQCSKRFESLCSKAFTHRRGVRTPVLKWVVENYNHSRYETQPLEDALASAFSEEQYLFGGQRQDSGALGIKAAVTATSAGGNVVVIANYNRLCQKKLPYHFQRPEKLRDELKTWEAARATSAAPLRFRSFSHEPSKQVYIDGGLYHSNPIRVADEERKLIWPALQSEEPDIMLSIGTAHPSPGTVKAPSRWRPQKGLISHSRNMAMIARDHVHPSLDAEATWQEYLTNRNLTELNRERYIRVDPELSHPVPKLDDVEQMAGLKMEARHIIAATQQIPKLAERLVAACFYLDTTGDIRHLEQTNRTTFEVTSYFHCRFLPDAFEIKALGEFFKQRTACGGDPCFLVREEGTGAEQTQRVLITKNVVDRMIHDYSFRMDGIQIRSSTRTTKTHISLCLGHDRVYPISGCPRLLHAEKPQMKASRHALSSSNSFRWKSRSSTSRKGRQQWKPPLPCPEKKRDFRERYASTSPSDLKDVVCQVPGDQDVRQLPQNPTPELSGVSIGELDGLSAPHELDGAVEAFYVAQEHWQAPPEWRVFEQHFLTLRKGNVVRVTGACYGGWWYGHLYNEAQGGLVPPAWLTLAGADDRLMFNSSELAGTKCA